MMMFDRRGYVGREFPLAGDNSAQFLVVDPKRPPFGPDDIAPARHLAQAGMKVNPGIEVEDGVAYVMQQRGGIECEYPFVVEAARNYFRDERRGYGVFPKFTLVL